MTLPTVPSNSTQENNEEKPNSALALKPSFKDAVQQYTCPSPTPSPLKRKTPSSSFSSPPTKRITRSASSTPVSKITLTPKTTLLPSTASSLPISSRPTRSTSFSTPSPTKTAKPRAKKSSKRHSNPTASTSAPINNLLRDALVPDLHILFVGTNPGLQTASTGFAYAHPSNLFYPLLHASGITPQRCNPDEYYSLVKRYGLGHTNIVWRPSQKASDLSKKEMEEGVAVIEEKAAKYKPGCICLAGKSVWDAVERVWRREKRWGEQGGAVSGAGREKEEFRYGWQEAWMGGNEEWEGARVFVATSSSGLAISTSWEEKVGVWKELGKFVNERREARGYEGIKDDDVPIDNRDGMDASQAGSENAAVDDEAIRGGDME